MSNKISECDWEAEFDKQFNIGYLVEEDCAMLEYFKKEPNAVKIKSFIRTLLTKRKVELDEKNS